MRPLGAHGEEDKLQTVVIQQQEQADGRTRRYRSLEDIAAPLQTWVGWKASQRRQRVDRAGHIGAHQAGKQGLGVGMEEGCVYREAPVIPGNCKPGLENDGV